MSASKERVGPTPGATRAAIALRKELAESSIGSWFADGQGINDERNAMVQWAARVIDREAGIAEMFEALEDIAEPMRAIQREAAASGSRINGVIANELCNDANWLREKAKAVIAKARGQR